MFDDWCDIDETARGERKKLCGLTEKAGGRAAIKDELIERVRSHYDKLEQVADDVERLGFPGASAILRERLPRTARERSGELGEIIASEFIEHHTGFRIPVRRLRYKDGREMALRGDDYVGIDEDDEQRLLFLKGEAKSGRTVPQGVVADARERLSENDGRPTTISLWTMTRSGQPGRTRIVGWILRLRVTSWSPARAPLCCADSRIARTRSLSLLPKLNSEPTPSSVESATPFNSCHVCRSILSARPA